MSPYKDPEKRKTYNRNYRKKEREMIKQFRAEQKKELDSSVQLHQEDKKQ